MGLVRAFECDDYRPEYGLLLLHDMEQPDDLGAGDLPRGHGDGTSPTGTFAGAGAGWVAAQARDADQMVRLELHDGPPDNDAEFDDVLETPYYAGSGSLALSTLTGGPAGQDEFDLGDAVRYRVRVARRADTWLLRFWPDPALEPPVWFARSSAAVRAGGDGWHSELPHMLMPVAAVAGNLARGEHGGWATEDQLDRWWRTHGPLAGLDERGGGRLWTVRNHPPALTLFPVEPDPQAQVLWLPHDGRTRANGTYEMTPTWEDPDHVLFAYEPDHRRPEPATGVRLLLRDGSAERLPAAGRARSVLFVEPLLTP